MFSSVYKWYVRTKIVKLQYFITESGDVAPNRSTFDIVTTFTNIPFAFYTATGFIQLMSIMSFRTSSILRLYFKSRPSINMGKSASEFKKMFRFTF